MKNMKRQSTRNKFTKKNKNENETKVIVGASLSRKKAGYIIPTMNCYPRNG